MGRAQPQTSCTLPRPQIAYLPDVVICFDNYLFLKVRFSLDGLRHAFDPGCVNLVRILSIQHGPCWWQCAPGRMQQALSVLIADVSFVEPTAHGKLKATKSSPKGAGASCGHRSPPAGQGTSGDSLHTSSDPSRAVAASAPDPQPNPP